MKRIVMFLLLMALVMAVIFLGIVLGDRGPWYLAWLLGTATIVLCAVSGGAMLDAQDEHIAEQRSDVVP